MKLIKPTFEILEQSDLFQHIELCGRTAYKSEDKITKDSAKPFVDMLIKRGHTAVLEHGTVYLIIPNTENLWKIMKKYEENPYSLVWYISFKGNVEKWYITTNYRVLVENDWLEDLQYQCNPTKYHAKRITVKFVCDRGVSHEFVRHRVFSFVQESTRYCNYGKQNEVTFIIPSWMPAFKSGTYEVDWDTIDGVTYWGWYNGIGKQRVLSDWGMLEDGIHKGPGPHDEYLSSLAMCEYSYLNLLKLGWTPQQARSVLPNALKTELIMTGTVSQWYEFFRLRCAPDAHPQARELAQPLEQEFIKRGLI